MGRIKWETNVNLQYPPPLSNTMTFIFSHTLSYLILTITPLYEWGSWSLVRSIACPRSHGQDVSHQTQPPVHLSEAGGTSLDPTTWFSFHLLQESLPIFLAIPSWPSPSPQSPGVLGSGTAPTVCVCTLCQLLQVWETTFGPFSVDMWIRGISGWGGPVWGKWDLSYWKAYLSCQCPVILKY